MEQHSLITDEDYESEIQSPSHSPSHSHSHSGDSPPGDHHATEHQALDPSQVELPEGEDLDLFDEDTDAEPHAQHHGGDYAHFPPDPQRAPLPARTGKLGLPDRDYTGGARPALPSKGYTGGARPALPSKGYTGGARLALPHKQYTGGARPALPGNGYTGNTSLNPSPIPGQDQYEGQPEPMDVDDGNDQRGHHNHREPYPPRLRGPVQYDGHRAPPPPPRRPDTIQYDAHHAPPPPTGAPPAQTPAPKKDCPNCGGQHSLANCLGPIDAYGYIHGCGKCNTLQHNLANCHRGLKASEVRHFVFKARDGKAPVIWDTDLLDPEYPADWLDRHRPWTRDFAIRQRRACDNIFSQDIDHRVRDTTWQQHGFDRNLIGPQIHPTAVNRKRSAQQQLPSRSSRGSGQVGPRRPAPPQRQYPGAGRATSQGSDQSQQQAPLGYHNPPIHPGQHMGYPPYAPHMIAPPAPYYTGLPPVGYTPHPFGYPTYPTSYAPYTGFYPPYSMPPAPAPAPGQAASRGYEDPEVSRGRNDSRGGSASQRERSMSPVRQRSQDYRQRDDSRDRSHKIPPKDYRGESKGKLPPKDYKGNASTSHRQNNSDDSVETNDVRRRRGDPNDSRNQVPLGNRVEIPGQCSNCLGGLHPRYCPEVCGKCGQAGHMIWHCVKR
ncbi:hypothetical protein VTL71DRAFT_3029 [Oculimacula yallundae]|uniref:CCHC-type domain-containing protein n=1 Tax=Oculimacula yallundae TaxID=86028 RepID=A0ABR4C7V7_9HELO